LEAFVKEWNEHAQPFKWNSQSAAKVIAKYEKPEEVAAEEKVVALSLNMTKELCSLKLCPEWYWETLPQNRACWNYPLVA
jgi:hypothetical protein